MTEDPLLEAANELADLRIESEAEFARHEQSHWQFLKRQHALLARLEKAEEKVRNEVARRERRYDFEDAIHALEVEQFELDRKAEAAQW